MDDLALTESLVYDLVDNWRDEHRARYVAWNLVHVLQADNMNVLAIMGNRTILLNLFSVIFEAIMKYDFRVLYVRVFNILMGTSHANSMFMFQEITSKKGHFIYKILLMSLENNDVALLRESTAVRAKAGKQGQFRIKFEDVNKTGYGKLARLKISLYRDYFSKQDLKIEICELIFKDLYGTLVGQPALKNIFCMHDGFANLLNLFNNPCFKSSDCLTSIIPSWCNVINTLLEVHELDPSTMCSLSVMQVLEKMKEVVEKEKGNVHSVEAALPVVLKSLKLMEKDVQNSEMNTFFSSLSDELKLLHRENMTIYQSCAIVKMVINKDCQKEANGDESKPRAESRSSRPRTRTKSASKRSRAIASRDNTIVTPRVSRNVLESPSNSRVLRSSRAWAFGEPPEK